MRENNSVLVSLAFSFLAIGFSSFQLLGFATVRSNSPKLSPISLTVVGINGPPVVLNENDVAALPSCRAYARPQQMEM